MGALLDAGMQSRSATHQFAEELLDGLAVASIVSFGNGASLAPQFEAKELVLQLIEAAADVAVRVLNPARADRRRGCSAGCAGNKRRLGARGSSGLGVSGPACGDELRAPQQIQET